MMGGGDSMAPCSTLNVPQARPILLERLVRPAMANKQMVVAVRLTWPKDSPRQNLWQQIVRLRRDLDAITCRLPSCAYFVSAITAVKQNDQFKQPRVWPAVGYWAVLREPLRECKLIMDLYNQNLCGAAVKLMLQPYQTTEKDLSSVLFNLVKDNVRGCVPRLVQISQQMSCGEGQPAWEPVMKICVLDRGVKEQLQEAVDAFQRIHFYTGLVEMFSD